MTNKELGSWGETLAKKYLIKKGYIIIAQNLRLGRLELDLVAIKNKKVYFFEIKTRLTRNHKNEDSFLSQKQIINLKKAANTYAALNKISFKNLNFGLIAITRDNKNVTALRCYLNIF